MKALDIGCGSEPELWVSGADLCDDNIAPDLEYSSAELEGRQIFRQRIDADNPKLPVENGIYDFVWCGSAWDWMNDLTKHLLVKEMGRILKVGGRAIVRDLKYIEEGDPEWEAFSVRGFLEELRYYFPDTEWFSYAYYDEDIDPKNLDEGKSKGCLWLLHLEKL